MIANKYIKRIIIAVAIFTSGISVAEVTSSLTQAQVDAGDFSEAKDLLVSDLEGVNYITYKGWDFVWASPVNVEIHGNNLNILYPPSIQKNWTFLESYPQAKSIFDNELTIENFKDSEGGIIHATQFFNNNYHYVNEMDFSGGLIRSQFVTKDDLPWIQDLLRQAETVFVRNVADRPVDIIIPEGTTPSGERYLNTLRYHMLKHVVNIAPTPLVK